MTSFYLLLYPCILYIHSSYHIYQDRKQHLYYETLYHSQIATNIIVPLSNLSSFQLQNGVHKGNSLNLIPLHLIYYLFRTWTYYPSLSTVAFKLCTVCMSFFLNADANSYHLSTNTLNTFFKYVLYTFLNNWISCFCILKYLSAWLGYLFKILIPTMISIIIGCSDITCKGSSNSIF